MITFSTVYDALGYDSNGAISQVPINSYLDKVEIDNNGVKVVDSSGDWGYISYQNTTYDSNIELFHYVNRFTLINKVRTKKIEICGRDLRLSNSVPITLIGAPGIGLINLPISIAYNYKHIGVDFDFTHDLFIHSSDKTHTDNYFNIDKTIINASSDRSFGLLYPSASTQNALSENKSIILKADIADASSGDGYLVIYITYSIVEESWYDGVYCT